MNWAIFFGALAGTVVGRVLLDTLNRRSPRAAMWLAVSFVVLGVAFVVYAHWGRP